MCNTMWVCKCTELCLWSGDIFRLWSAERLGWAAACSAWIKMQCVDHCWVPVWRTTHEGGWSVWGGLYCARLLPQFNLANTGISPSCFHSGMLIPTINLHLVAELRGFLVGTWFCVVLLHCKALYKCTSKLSSWKNAVYKQCLYESK